MQSRRTAVAAPPELSVSLIGRAFARSAKDKRPELCADAVAMRPAEATDFVEERARSEKVVEESGAPIEGT